MIVVLETCPAIPLSGETYAPKWQAPSLSLSHSLIRCHLIWLTAFQATFQESSCQDRLYMFEDNEVVFRVIRNGRNTNLRHVSRYHRFDLDWLLRRIKLNPFYFRSICAYHRTLGRHVFLTKGAFTTIQWKSLMRFFHTHPPCNLEVDSSLSKSSCSAVPLK